MDKNIEQKTEESHPNLSEKYPSLELAYERVKDVLNQQKETANSLDSKASTFIAVATATFGVGLSLGISRVMNARLDYSIYLVLVVITLVPVLVYYRIWGLTLKTLRLRAFITLNHPCKIRDEFWHLPKVDFIYDMLLHTEKAFKKNDEKLVSKAKYVDELLSKTVWETFIVLAWITIVLLVSSYLN